MRAGHFTRLASAASACLLIAACGSSAPAGVSTPTAAAAAIPAPARVAARRLLDWPEFGLNPQRTDTSEDATAITSANVAHLRQMKLSLAGTVDSSPVYLHGVSVGGAPHNVVVVTTTYGKTLAIDADSGKTLWTFTPPGYDRWAGGAQITVSSPLAGPDRLWVYAASPNGLIHKLSLANGSEDRSGAWPVSVTHDATHEKLGAALNIDGPDLVAATSGYFGDAPPYQGQEFGGAENSRTTVKLGPPDTAGVEDLRSAIAQTEGVAAVAPAKLNPAGEVATITVYPRSSPQAYATTQLVERLRDKVVPPLEARTGMAVYVGGVTAGSVDFATTLGHKLPLFIGVVVLLSALLLMIVFRSLVIPLQAAVMNLLSIGASLGVIVAIFQWGWLGSLFGVQQGPIESFIPVMMFAIVFGLSMDYEVFLISRMHERWVHTGDDSRAVQEGLALTGRVITAAAAIMVCVFLSFMLGEERVIKEFGLSLASAVFLDALVVRCLLLPAVLSIIGARTWQLPARLDRLLPRLNIEGSSLYGAGEHSDQTPHTSQRARGEVATEGADG
jgi:hypothetical protein